MKTEIIKQKGDWQEVCDDCRSTVGKDGLGKEPSRKFKREMLIAEHSPIRDISFKWRWRDIPSWIATHWSRHKWECFIRTQRTDRSGVDRNQAPQDAPVTFVGEANVQHLIDTFRKRLCYMAAPETRAYAEDFKDTLRTVDADIAAVLVPNCVYRCGCPEPGRCKRWERFRTWAREEKDEVDMAALTIQERYDLWHEYEEEG